MHSLHSCPDCFSSHEMSSIRFHSSTRSPRTAFIIPQLSLETPCTCNITPLARHCDSMQPFPNAWRENSFQFIRTKKAKFMSVSLSTWNLEIKWGEIFENWEIKAPKACTIYCHVISVPARSEVRSGRDGGRNLTWLQGVTQVRLLLQVIAAHCVHFRKENQRTLTCIWNVLLLKII